MLQYTIQRILLAIPTLLGITLLTFLIMRLAPGDPVDLFLGGAAGGEGISTDHQGWTNRYTSSICIGFPTWSCAWKT